MPVVPGGTVAMAAGRAMFSLGQRKGMVMAIGVGHDPGATGAARAAGASGMLGDTHAPEVKAASDRVVEIGLKALERLLLIVVVAMTLIASAAEVQAVIATRTVNLGDILLMFLYAEVLAMVSVFYTGRGLPIVFPIFIAITALARLIVLQGKEMDPANILIEAGAILLLAVAAVVLLRFVRPGG